MVPQPHRYTRALAALAGVTLSLSGATRVAAQRLSPGYLHGTLSDVSPPARAVVQAVQPNHGGMILGGLVGGAVGLFAGGYIGASLGDNRNCEDFCGLEEAVWGAAAGVSTLLPLGVHVANGSRGKYGSALGVSLAIGAVGMGIAYAANNGVPLLFVPVAQLISSVVIEHQSSTRSP
jgi:hypothetical protein